MIGRTTIFLLALLAVAGCTGGPDAGLVADESGGVAAIFPDYAGCTVPPNIAPMNFALQTPHDKARVTFTGPDGEWSVTSRRGQFTIPPGRWKRMLAASAGSSVSVRIAAMNEGRWTGYAPFELHVAREPVDPYIAYRLIEPLYQLWNDMGIYQRELGRYTQTPILENSSTDESCMNCHSFRMQDPDRLLLHLRGSIAATMVVGDKVEKLDTKTTRTISPLVYPAWHPGGRFAAFSVNRTEQGFHTNDPNRVEVYDNASDVVVYDLEGHRLIASPLMHDTDEVESFPAFSPDGGTLYFSSSEYVDDVRNRPDSVRYSLCSISFDAASGSFGETVDTLYNARLVGRSASFPRVSPDGRWLMYTLSDYGGFAIWHKEADLWMVDLTTGEHAPLTEANGPDADSYHSWSSNSRWVVFASRRIDGLYSRPFIAYIDARGRAGKAFVVPQRNVKFYHRSLYSYNVPEFIKGRVPDRRRAISRAARGETSVEVEFTPAR
jgi:hypothetical protein